MAIIIFAISAFCILYFMKYDSFQHMYNFYFKSTPKVILTYLYPISEKKKQTNFKITVMKQ